MKKYLFLIVGIVLVGCTSNIEPTPSPKEDGIVATIEQPEQPILTKGFTWDNALKFTWEKNENLVVFGGKDAALLRTLASGVESSKIESMGFKLMDDVSYYAFIPAYNFNITTESSSIPVSFEGQRQTSNNNSAHLKYYDYACATATKVSDSNCLEFKLKNQVAWIVLEHYFAEDVSGITSITLSSADKLFLSSAKIDATTSDYVEYSKKFSSELTLNFGKEGTGLDFSKGEYLRAFFTTAPVDLSGKELTITAHKSDGSSVELMKKTYDNCNINKNSTVVIKTSEFDTSLSVATIAGRQFSSLDAAIAAAEKEKYNTTITMADNVVGNFVIDSPKLRGKEVIIDLNGHSIMAETGCAVLVKRGDVRLKNGTIESKDFVGVKFDPQAKSSSVYLVGCTINSVQGAVCTSTATKCKIVIYGGKFTATNNAVIAGNGSLNYGGSTDARDAGNTIIIRADSNGAAPEFYGYMSDANSIACGLYAPWKDNITISAAKFNIENGVGILCRGGSITIEDAEIITSGGERTGTVADGKNLVPCKTIYVDETCKYPDIANAKIVIKGGKYSDNFGEKYVADGYSYASFTGESPLLYNIISNGEKIQNAISTIEKGGNVVINYYVSLKEQLKVSKNFKLTLADDAIITGDCSCPVLDFCQDGGENVISGKGSIIGTNNSKASVHIFGAGQVLTFDSKDVTVKGGEEKELASAIMIWDGKVVIRDGHFISGRDKKGNDSPAVYLIPYGSSKYKAELEITGGTFESVSGNARYLINCDDECISQCKIIITGGTFIGFNPANSEADKVNGTNANWVPDGYESVETPTGSNIWVVSKK